MKNQTSSGVALASLFKWALALIFVGFVSVGQVSAQFVPNPTQTAVPAQVTPTPLPASRVISVSVSPTSPARTAFVRGDYLRTLARYEIRQGGSEPVNILGFSVEHSSTVSQVYVLVNDGEFMSQAIEAVLPNGVRTSSTTGFGTGLTTSASRNITIDVIGYIAYDQGFEDAWVRLRELVHNAQVVSFPTTVPATHAVIDRQVNEGTSNVSLRANVSPTQPATMGFVVKGDRFHSYAYLIRVAGPALSKFGVQNVLQDPQVQVFDGQGNPVQQGINDNWDPGLAGLFTGLGAFPFDIGSKDSAVLISLNPGSYTVEVKGFGNGTGAVLIEAYAITDTVVWGQKGSADQVH